jgi:hypothetical protein
MIAARSARDVYATPAASSSANGMAKRLLGVANNIGVDHDGAVAGLDELG